MPVCSMQNHGLKRFATQTRGPNSEMARASSREPDRVKPRPAAAGGLGVNELKLARENLGGLAEHLPIRQVL